MINHNLYTYMCVKPIDEIKIIFYREKQTTLQKSLE